MTLFAILLLLVSIPLAPAAGQADQGVAAPPASVIAGAGDRPMTLEETQQWIAQNGYHWTARRTSVSDIPWDEFQRNWLGYRPAPDWGKRERVNLAPGSPDSPLEPGDLPAQWDWREHEGVTPVKDQDGCGSCWAFCSVAAIEGCARIHDHEIYDLSEQQMLDCNAYGYGCGGGEMSSCYEIFMSYGAVPEEAIPYHHSDGARCTQAEFEPLAKISNWFYIDETVESIKAAIYTYGPVGVAMVVLPDFMSYGGGCYDHPSTAQLNHCVLLVGWDDNLCGGAWIGKNSWNTGWGDAGYFYIRYGSAGIGSHAAAIVHIPRAIVRVDHTPPETRTTPGAAVPIDATITSNLAEMNPDSVVLRYRIDGGEFSSIRMTPGSSANAWHAEIPALPRPSEVEYYIRAVDLQGHGTCIPMDAPGSCYTYDIAFAYDPLEAASGGWSVGDPDDDATSGVWERVAPVGTVAQPDSDHTSSGHLCWITGQHPEGGDAGANDVDGGKTTLTSPQYGLYKTATAIAKYARWYSNDRGAAPDEDTWLVQARNDYGDWVDVERTTQSSNAWIIVRADLKELLGPELGAVQFRFVASDEGRPSSVEAAIDDFVILADPDTTVVSWNAKGPGFLASPAWPNPMREETRIRLQIEEEMTGAARIYGPDGRFVTSLFQGELDRRRHELVWDGRDDTGRAVPSGVYYCLLDLGGRKIRNSVIVVR